MTGKIVKRIFTGLTIFFFVLAVVIFIFGTVAMRDNKMLNLFGYTVSVVPTTSMANPDEPDPIMQYEVVIGRCIDYDSLEIGDDIIYFSNEHKIYIVHRIVEETAEGFYTKGTNNPYKDTEPVTPDNYVSKVVAHKNVLNIGKLVTNNRSLIFLALIFIFVLIIVTEVLNIFKLKSEEDLKKAKEEKQKALEATREQIRQEIAKELAEDNNSGKPKET